MNRGTLVPRAPATNDNDNTIAPTRFPHGTGILRPATESPATRGEQVGRRLGRAPGADGRAPGEWEV
jgi:hypothetical protein